MNSICLNVGLSVEPHSADAAWAIEGDAIVRFDLVRGRATARVTETMSPSFITFGEGHVWVATSAGGAAGTVWQIDPKSNSVVTRTQVGRGVAALAVGLGSVWVGCSIDHEVWRIETTR